MFNKIRVIVCVLWLLSGEALTDTSSALYSDKQWLPLTPLNTKKKNEVKPFPPSDNSYESPATEIYISIGNFMDGDRYISLVIIIFFPLLLSFSLVCSY